MLQAQTQAERVPVEQREMRLAELAAGRMDWVAGQQLGQTVTMMQQLAPVVSVQRDAQQEFVEPEMYCRKETVGTC